MIATLTFSGDTRSPLRNIKYVPSINTYLIPEMRRKLILWTIWSRNRCFLVRQRRILTGNQRMDSDRNTLKSI